jgi:hypothetical protein
MCVQQAVALDPTTRGGALVLVVKVHPNGQVSSADLAQNSPRFPPAIASCLTDVFKGATFAAPGGGGATVTLPFDAVIREPR